MTWDQATREAVALLMKRECRLYGPRLAANMRWAKRLLERGRTHGVDFGDLRAAIRGLPRVYRVRLPWEPCQLFCRKNAALWQEAMSAGRKLEEREAKRVGQTPLIAELNRLAREAQSA